MPKRRLIVLQNDQAWNDYLIEAFNDTPSTPEIVTSAAAAPPLIRQGNPDVVFANPSLLTAPLTAALRMHRTSNADFRVFRLGFSSAASASIYPFDDSFNEIPPSLYDFQKQLAHHLPLPDPIRLLIVDDEPGVGEIFQDYFDHRTQPTFIVETAKNGVEAEVKTQKQPPHVLILDIKMPERDGRELYRELRRRETAPPTIVFFDLVSSDEVLEIRKWGSPAFVEKGSRSSAMPEMAALIKKLTYFG